MTKYVKGDDFMVLIKKGRFDFGDLIIVLLTILVLYFFIDTNVKLFNDREEVKGDHLITTGWIVDYRKIGTSMTPKLTYNYYVKWRLYSRKMSPTVDFSECIKDFSKCEKKRFRVLYSKSHPYKSLIDLRKAMRDSSDIKLPIYLNDFE